MMDDEYLRNLSDKERKELAEMLSKSYHDNYAWQRERTVRIGCISSFYIILTLIVIIILRASTVI